ncbi:dynein light chain 1, axonemal [Caerostris extrusa]|uniref:Dynein light chain 1, axonemal n=1 Tax=Caerostris extrusa TaxID=172846 RepID=A0AAV4PGF9_CAEEX|nr:dynein light chain 1, axonemal [Caerostris extrusa]
MGKGIAFKDALKKWSEKTGENAAEATVVKMNGWIPSIDKLDASLATLTNCERLSLSTNMIDKLTNLNSLSKVKDLLCGEEQPEELERHRGTGRHPRGTVGVLQQHRQAEASGQPQEPEGALPVEQQHEGRERAEALG